MEEEEAAVVTPNKLDVEAVLSQLDSLYANKTKIKTQSIDDRNTLEVPFHLQLDGRRGRLQVVPDPSFDGIATNPRKIVQLHTTIPSLAPPKPDVLKWCDAVLNPSKVYPREALQLVWSPLSGNNNDTTHSSSEQRCRPPIIGDLSGGGRVLLPAGISDEAMRIELSHPQREIVLIRGNDGIVHGWEERDIQTEASSSSEANPNSRGARVASRNPRQFSRGSVNQKAFRPGGFEDSDDGNATTGTAAKKSTNDEEIKGAKKNVEEEFVGCLPFGINEDDKSGGGGEGGGGRGDEEHGTKLKTRMTSLLTGPAGFQGIDFLLSVNDEKNIKNNSADRKLGDATGTNSGSHSGVYRAFENRQGLIDEEQSINDADYQQAEELRYRQQQREYRSQKQIEEDNRNFQKERKEAEEEEIKKARISRQSKATTMGRGTPSLMNELMKLRQSRGGSSAGLGQFTIDDVLDIGVDGEEENSDVKNVLRKAGYSVPVAEEREAKRKKEEGGERKVWAVMSREPVDDFHERIPDMAIKYPFELDRFQKEAIIHVENSRCVFVAAHTSAGKTVVAEYAVALACRHMTRAVYTSPIKTLSNQKFREFRKTFGENDVGLITGDVSINPEGTCLILTTEILRSMLYRGADLIRDIEWVIFDEVHYINDRDRGVVWEEVIMMLPSHVSIVMLSATVPNTFDFADWVGRTKKKPVHVVSTYKRPVPLQHFLWCHGKEFKILDDKGTFLTQGFRQARLFGKKQEEKDRGLGSGRWLQLVRFLTKLDLLPVVIFSFSKRVCEELSYTLAGLDLNDHKQKGLVYSFVDRSITRLAPVDRRLPQVRRVRELAARGIGVHHAGMLPLLKEIVEMLFARGVIKVLFATETFAMGVNMPTRTVVFNGTRKHDGTQFRELLPSEYTQMAGRAGRRGLDLFGVVIIFCRNDEIPQETGTRQLLTGKATRLQSKFRLTFNMLLNLLRQEDVQTKEFIKRSYAEAPSRRAAPTQKKALALSEEKLKILPDPGCQGAKTYLAMREVVENLYSQEVSTILRSTSLTSRHLSAGRILLVKLPLALPGTRDYPAVAVVLKTPDRDSNSLTALVLIAPESDCVDFKSSQVSASSRSRNRSSLMGGDGIIDRKGETSRGERWMFAPIRAENVARITKLKVRVDADSCLSMSARMSAGAIEAAAGELGKIYKKNTGGGGGGGGGKKKKKLGILYGGEGREYMAGLAALNPQKDMRIKDFEFIESFRHRLDMEEQLKSTATCAVCLCDPEKRKTNLEAARAAGALEKRISRLRAALSDDRISLLGELEQRTNVLKALDYIAEDKSVLLKGRVACEINTCDCLIVTELIFENVLDELDGPEAVALLSTLVYQRRSDDDPQLTPELDKALTRLNKITRAIGNVQLKYGMDVSPDQYARDQIHTGLAQVAYEWAAGTKFYQICEMTDIPEGSIVRCILRLHETLKDVRNAARVIGDPKLYQKMEACAEIIKRDIVFAASLYVS